MAIDLSCQVVVEDFDRAAQHRVVFRRVDKDLSPGLISSETVGLAGKVPEMDRYTEHRINQTVTLVGGRAKVKISDLTRDSHESIDGQWTGAELLVRGITFTQDSNEVLHISGQTIESLQGFAAEQWQDEEGNHYWRGQSDSDGWRMHPGAWVEIPVDLPAGEFLLTVELGSALRENNRNDAMQAKVAAYAIQNWGKAESTKKLRRQIADILRRATSQTPTPVEVSRLLTLLERSASAARKRTPWYRDQGNHCETWWIWPDEELDHDGYWNRYHDGDGMMRGWSTVLHAVISSYGYLHD